MIFSTIAFLLIYTYFLFNPNFSNKLLKRTTELQIEAEDNPTDKTAGKMIIQLIILFGTIGFSLIMLISYLIYLSQAFTLTPLFTGVMLILFFIGLVISSIKVKLKNKQKLDYRKLEDRPKIFAQFEKKKSLFGWTYHIVVIVYFVYMLITLI